MLLIPKLRISHLLPKDPQNSLCLWHQSIILLWLYLANHLLRGFSILSCVLKHFSFNQVRKCWNLTVDASAESNLGKISNQLQISRSKKKIFLGCFSHNSLLQRDKEWSRAAEWASNSTKSCVNDVVQRTVKQVWWSYAELLSHVISHCMGQNHMHSFSATVALYFFKNLSDF